MMTIMLNRVPLTRLHSAEGLRPCSQREGGFVPGLDWTSA